MTVDGDAGRLGPETATLERIGGQFESATGLSMQRSEIGPVAADVGRGQRVGDLAPVADALTQRDDRPRRGQVLRPDLHRSPGQHRLRTDLHQHRASQRRHGAHAFGELHRLAGMPPPVLSVERGLGREHGAGAVADQRQRRDSELQLRCVRLEFSRAPDPAVPSGRRGWSPARCSGSPRHRIWRRSVSRSSPGPESTVLGPL